MANSVSMPSFDNTIFSRLICQSCGSTVLSPEGALGSFCHFCEMYIEKGKEDERELESAVISKANKAMANGDWKSVFDTIAPLAKSVNPITLYGFGSMYLAASDLTYNDVDYSLPGFMYPNAEKRSAEDKKYPNNAMQLVSKAREFMFSSIYIVNNVMKSQDPLLMYTAFISEVRMKRIAKARQVRDSINKVAPESIIARYANMVYAVDSRSAGAEKYVKQLTEKGEINAFYYLAKHLINIHELKGAEMILKRINDKVNMPMSFFLLKKLEDVNEATRL